MIGWRSSQLSLLALFLAALAFHVNFIVVRVDGTSMMPNFEDGDLVLVWKGVYHHAAPRRGDVVVARLKSDLIIKRVLGLPEESAEIRNGKLLVNDRPVSEKYRLQGKSVNVGRGELGPGKYALFGDNRDVPADQMIAAVVTRSEIVGKVLLHFKWNLLKQLAGISGEIQ